MISLDSSIIPAIAIFLVLVVVLNKVLFQPLLQVQTERESRTTGLTAQARNQLDHHLELLGQYQAAIKNCRMEGYRRQEQMRAEAMKGRAESLAGARANAEKLMQEARDSIQTQVRAAKAKLEIEAREIAGGIASSVLGRTA